MVPSRRMHPRAGRERSGCGDGGLEPERVCMGVCHQLSDYGGVGKRGREVDDDVPAALAGVESADFSI